MGTVVSCQRKVTEISSSKLIKAVNCWGQKQVTSSTPDDLDFFIPKPITHYESPRLWKDHLESKRYIEQCEGDLVYSEKLDCSLCLNNKKSGTKLAWTGPSPSISLPRFSSSEPSLGMESPLTSDNHHHDQQITTAQVNHVRECFNEPEDFSNELTGQTDDLPTYDQVETLPKEIEEASSSLDEAELEKVINVSGQSSNTFENISETHGDTRDELKANEPESIIIEQIPVPLSPGQSCQLTDVPINQSNDWFQGNGIVFDSLENVSLSSLSSIGTTNDSESEPLSSLTADQTVLMVKRLENNDFNGNLPQMRCSLCRLYKLGFEPFWLSLDDDILRIIKLYAKLNECLKEKEKKLWTEDKGLELKERIARLRMRARVRVSIERRNNGNILVVLKDGQCVYCIESKLIPFSIKLPEYSTIDSHENYHHD